MTRDFILDLAERIEADGYPDALYQATKFALDCPHITSKSTTVAYAEWTIYIMFKYLSHTFSNGMNTVQPSNMELA